MTLDYNLHKSIRKMISLIFILHSNLSHSSIFQSFFFFQKYDPNHLKSKKKEKRHSFAEFLKRLQIRQSEQLDISYTSIKFLKYNILNIF